MLRRRLLRRRCASSRRTVCAPRAPTVTLRAPTAATSLPRPHVRAPPHATGSSLHALLARHPRHRRPHNRAHNLRGDFRQRRRAQMRMRHLRRPHRCMYLRHISRTRRPLRVRNRLCRCRTRIVTDCRSSVPPLHPLRRHRRPPRTDSRTRRGRVRGISGVGYGRMRTETRARWRIWACRYLKSSRMRRRLKGRCPSHGASGDFVSCFLANELRWAFVFFSFFFFCGTRAQCNMQGMNICTTNRFLTASSLLQIALLHTGIFSQGYSIYTYIDTTIPCLRLDFLARIVTFLTCSLLVD